MRPLSGVRELCCGCPHLISSKSSFFLSFHGRQKRNALPHAAENICEGEMKAWRKGAYINTSGKRKEVREGQKSVQRKGERRK